MNDRLPLEECQAFYSGIRDGLAVFNRVLLGRLLEESPTERARSELLPVIAVEFGPPASAAHPAIFKRFLRSLGVPESETHESADLLEPTNACAAEVEALCNMSWCELLARLLVGETQGPVVFPVILDALRRNYGLSSFDVQYFSIHATHDKKDTEILFDLLARTVKSQADEDAVLRVVDEAFDGGRYLVTGCRLEPSPRYRFADYSSSMTSGSMRKKAVDVSEPTEFPAESPKGASEAREVGISLERVVDDANAAPIREIVHRAWAALRPRSYDEPLPSHPRPTDIGAVRHLLQGARRSAQEWEFVVAPRLLQMCPDLDARVLLWQVAHASYGTRRSEVPAMKLLTDLLSALSHENETSVAEEPSRKAALRQSSFLELVSRGLVAENLIALECLPVVKGALLSAPSRLRESDLTYFDRARRDAGLGLEVGIDFLARYAAADAVDGLVERALHHALDASPFAPFAPFAERARSPHSRRHPDVTATIA
ncbi:iron-containing redox enzyme family protein [Pendulispora brunnea]|uniref:Iron-containing redox enzyme family protein n=1 Tax=Pendulispora brunnea TaxID=2905690 RepID=A0ABZ2JYV1_9BACT